MFPRYMITRRISPSPLLSREIKRLPLHIYMEAFYKQRQVSLIFIQTPRSQAIYGS